MIVEHRSDADWLRLAFQTAASQSDDPHTQNGAVLVPKFGLVAASANHLPPGISATSWRLVRPAKYRYMEHAERGAIYAAARVGTKTEGAALYCAWFACPDCARAIIEAGIRQVVGHVTPRRLTPGRWEAEVVAGERMLMEAGVAVRWLADPLGVAIQFNGEVMEC